MPGTDGLEAARQIRTAEAKRKSASAIPIIVLTDSAFEEDMAKSLAGIFTGSMGKPADEKKLLDTLSWALFRK
jgi:CheY-like chemotaxis protein